MYTVTKRLEVSASHHLVLDYASKCQNLHGHNWIIHVTCQAEALDHNGMEDGAHIRLMVTRGKKKTPNQDPRFALGQATIVDNLGGASGSMSNKGTGEKKLELDRRKIEHRITELKKELEDL